MIIFRKLVEFEFSRFSSLPGLTRRGLQFALFYLVIMLAGGLYLFKGTDAPEAVFAIGVTLSFSITMIMALFHMIGYWAQPQREWWLTLPHPRIVLAGAKAWGLMLAGLRIVILILLACIGHYAIVTSSGMMQEVLVGQIAAIAGSSLLLAVSCLPVAVMLGLAVSTMYSGKARWALIPYIIVLQCPYMLVGLIMSIESADLQLISPTNTLLYSLIIIVVGWPLSYVLLKLIATKGLANMADVRLRMKSSAVYGQADGSTGTGAASDPKKKGFTVLYALERSRFQYYSSIKWVRIVGYTLLGLVALGAFLSSGHTTALLEMESVIFMLPVLAGSIFTMNRGGIDRKSMQWWLSFPHPRLQLLSAHLAGVWVTVARIIAAITAAFWLGAVLGMITGRMDIGQLPIITHWFVYSLVSYTTLLTVALGILQASYFFMKSKALALLIIPQYLLVSLQTVIVNKFFYPADFSYPIPNPDWRYAALLLGIGVPVAAYCITLGAKHLQRALNTEAKVAENN